MTDPSNGPDEASDLLESLRPHVTPLAGVDPDAALDDLEGLRGVFEDASIVGLGEATHGTREFFRFKHRLFRFLVAELGFRLFGLEANFSETVAIDDYVRTGRGDPEEALEAIYFWTWNTEEVRDLLEWIRSFNEGRPDGDRVRFYGFDAQFTAGPADAIAAYLERVDPAFLEEVEGVLAMLADEGLADGGGEADRDGADGDRESRVSDANRLVETLRARFRERQGAYVDRASDEEWRLANRHLRTLEQAIEMQTFDGGAAAGYETRDRIMADNVSWILAHENADRIALWAHNGHVMTGEWDDEDGSARTMGNVLADERGERYYALGFDFGSGSFQAQVERDDEEYELRECTVGDPPAESVASALSELGHETLFFDVDAASDDARLADLVARERPFRSFGAVYYATEGPEAHFQRFVLADQFDGLVFVDETSRAVPLDGF